MLSGEGDGEYFVIFNMYRIDNSNIAEFKKFYYSVSAWISRHCFEKHINTSLYIEIISQIILTLFLKYKQRAIEGICY